MVAVTGALPSRPDGSGSARLGIPIFGSNFWDPHWKRNSNSVFDSKNSGQIFFFQILLFKNREIGIRIPKFGIPKKINVGIQYTFILQVMSIMICQPVGLTMSNHMDLGTIWQWQS